MSEDIKQIMQIYDSMDEAQQLSLFGWLLEKSVENYSRLRNPPPDDVLRERMGLTEEEFNNWKQQIINTALYEL